MAEPKLLPPSMRQNKRYIVFEIISETPVKYPDVVSAIWNSMLDFLGELQGSDARTWLIQNLYNDKMQAGVIKCSHTHVEHVRAVLSLIQVIGESRCVIRVLGVTGTIKSAEEKYIAELRSAGNSVGGSGTD